MDAYVEAMRRYAAFAGRQGRGAYWVFLGIALLVTVMLTLITGIASPALAENVYGLCVLVHLLPVLAAGCRRLHDSGRSGWWQLVALIPFIGLPWILVLLLWRGDPGDNRFGPGAEAARGAGAA
jgi:uncharacterized membrane protein YhaH (DUF805 family)